MEVLKSGEDLVEAYNILCQELKSPTAAPFGLTYCEVPAAGHTAPHYHHEHEIFVIVKGEGRMCINEKWETIQRGQVVTIKAHLRHTLVNLCPNEPLIFYSIYWKDPREETPPLPSLKKKHLIFSAPPTPNGPLHLGHLSGPYLACDVLAKFLGLNNQVKYVSGTDEYQTYVPFKAWQSNQTSDGVISKYRAQISDVLKQFGSHFDAFVSPTRDEDYQNYVKSFFKSLIQKDKLVKKKVDAYFCKNCALYLHEAYISGACPRCQNSTNGNGCEQCGFVNDCIDLVNPICNCCQATPHKKTVEKYYFPTEQYRDIIVENWSDSSFNFEMKKFLKDLESYHWPDVSITHPGTWGIKAGDIEGQILYEWFEMAACYHYLGELFESNAWESSQLDISIGFGIDNSFFYLVFIPALLKAYDKKLNYPKHFITNQFYLLEHQKFSTSRNHAIWGGDLLKYVDSDVLRFYLAKTSPQVGETNFSLNDFKHSLQCDLIDGIENALNLAIDKLMPFNSGLPLISDALGNTVCYWDKMVDLNKKITVCYCPEQHDLPRVSLLLLELANNILELANDDAIEFDLKAISLSSNIVNFAKMAYPLMPNLAKLLLKMANQENLLATKWDVARDPLAAEHSTNWQRLDHFSKNKKGLESFSYGN